MTSYREPLWDVHIATKGCFTFLDRFRAALYIRIQGEFIAMSSSESDSGSGGLSEYVISRPESVRIEKNFARGLVHGEGHAFKTEAKVFLDTDRPRPGNNMYLFIDFCYRSRMRIGLFAVLCAEREFPPRNPTNLSYGSKTDNLRYKPRELCQRSSYDHCIFGVACGPNFFASWCPFL